MRNMSDRVLVVQAVQNSGGAVAPVVGTAVNASGFSRARFIFNFSNAATTGSLSTGMGLWQASTSGATFAQIAGASFAAVTSGQISGGANNVMIVDVPVVGATPWLKVSGGSWLNAGVAHGAVITLSNPVYLPPTHTAIQIVTV